MTLSGFIAITRPVNSIVAGIAGMVAYLIATGTIIPETVLLFLIVALVTAAGNVVNDYFDSDIDAINRPDRPIPSGSVGMVGAWRFSLLMFLSGIVISYFTNTLCFAIAIINAGLLMAYAARLKSTPFYGNLAVSYLSASIFLFGGALAGTTGLIHMLPVALITFFAMLTRELLKDAEDVKGDTAGGAVTLPIRIGIRPTARLAFVFTVLAVVASLVPYLWWGQWYLAGILVVDCVIVVAAILALRCTTSDCVRASRSTTILKLGMFASLVVFTLSAVFL
jgi:geranylgeranylglycerol-phosphate geranylgeranyltransferase